MICTPTITTTLDSIADAIGTMYKFYFDELGYNNQEASHEVWKLWSPIFEKIVNEYLDSGEVGPFIRSMEGKMNVSVSKAAPAAPPAPQNPLQQAGNKLQCCRCCTSSCGNVAQQIVGNP